MGILQRHVLTELLKVFALALFTLTTILLLVGLVQQAVKEGLTPIALLQAIPYLLPNALRFAVPGTLLFAACQVYGSLSASNELSAVKAAGISPMTLIGPGLILGLLLSLVSVWLNDIAVSWGHHGIRHVAMQSIDEIIYGVLKTKKSFSSNRMSILVRDVEGKRLLRPEISIVGQKNGEVISISATAAVIKSDAENQQIIVTLTDSYIRSSGPQGRTFEHPGQYTTSIPLVDTTAVDGIREASHHSMWQLPSWGEKMKRYHHQVGQLMAAKAAANLVAGHRPAKDDPMWQYWQDERDWSANQINRIKSEPHRRWANGFSCLGFVILGIPLAIHRKSKDAVGTFFAAFLPVLLLYYPIMALGVDRAKDGDWPVYGVWLGNVAVCAVGSFLLWRVVRH